MIRDHVKEFFIDRKLNCAEALLLSCAKEWGIEVSPETFHTMAGFGGGLACGAVCGALCGAVAACGIVKVETDSHQTEGFREQIKEYVEAFRQEFGSIDCSVLRPQFAVDDNRCLVLCQRTADLFDGANREEKA